EWVMGNQSPQELQPARPRGPAAGPPAEPAQVQAALQAEVAQRRRAEEQLRRAHRALSRCNQALTRAAGEEELLREVCRIIVDVAGYRLCWVGYAEQDEARTVRPVADAGYEEGYLRTVH